MREPILMPTLSDTMETGHLLKWLKKPGDRVIKGEALAEVETDKAVMEVEAFTDGYLAGPLAEDDSELPVGTVIGYLTDAQAQAGSENFTKEKPAPEWPNTAEPLKAEPSTVEPTTVRPASAEVDPHPAPVAFTDTFQPPDIIRTAVENSANKNIPASPFARGLARELGVDMTQIMAGPDGVIRASQVIAAMLTGTRPELEDGPDYTLLSMTPMQRAIARNMSAAASTPTFHVSARLSLEPLITLEKKQKLSLTLLLARACAFTIATLPRFNALYTVEGLAQREQIDIGIAVDIPNGLLTPVLRNAAQRPLEGLSKEWLQLKKKAEGKIHSHRLTPEDYQGATFYLSNLGMFNQVSHFDAIVPLGAAAILSLGAVQADGKAEFTLSCDHRVVYGADAARFLETLEHFLSSPKLIIETQKIAVQKV